MEDNRIIMSVGIAIRKKDKIILGCDKQQSTGDYKCLIDDKMIYNDDFPVNDIFSVIGNLIVFKSNNY